MCSIFATGVMAALFGSACAGAGQYVWVDEYRDTGSRPDTAYVIGPGDVIQVRVFNQDQLSTRARVRADGKISLPLLNDVSAAGLTAETMAGTLQTRLKSFIRAPLVTVSVEEARQASVYVSGEVMKPGAYALDNGTGVLHALVNAGGVTQYASTELIFVLRQDGPATTRIRFTYRDLIRLRGKASTFKLRPGDVIVVE
ncbi:MAG TPA: polysaccharide biosynthesis/export family protein [Anaeromyxobacteraceae bacterium]|nr:polysaccharide biosynthesis/export family protein [Anaeromyxobacteraceae bacterium]